MLIVFSDQAIERLDNFISEITRALEVARICDRTSRLLDSYRLNIEGRGFSAVRDIILDDIRRFTELGAGAYVSDLQSALFALEEEARGSTGSSTPCCRSNAEAYEAAN
jgi:hypothetical protein